MKQNFQKEIDSIVSQLITRYRPEKIILFGSAAHDRLTPGSDLDFLIIKDELLFIKNLRRTDLL